jgi:pseudomonalisin
VLVAAGDDGADDCQDRRGRSVNVLASNAHVTAVGGTALDAGFDANGDATGYVGETVWNDADGASGGGVSTLVSKPAFQSAPGVPADGFRDLPDVSLLASPSKAGYVMVADGSVVVAGGASAAAPSWAGIVALLNQTMHVDGSGPINATLYALGREQYAGSGTAVFHDVTLGSNSFGGVVGYAAGPGYDLATGLGTPDVALLAQTLFAAGNPTATATATPTMTASHTPTDTLTATAKPTETPSATVTEAPSSTPLATPPARPCVGDCNGSGDVSIDELLTLVNIALGTASISTCPAADANQNGSITVHEIVMAVDNALNGCSP